MKLWKIWNTDREAVLRMNETMKNMQLLKKEVVKAHKEWEQAYTAFQEATGMDEVDVAIYTLEAAERRYQILLKAAKQANLDWNAFQYGSFWAN
ncbi:DUF2508 family protein [Paenibacillus macerans]|uniref:DUF2508 family protein n=1 Tax=Paenibacillus macerans TaxID=44252 RepID=UPI00203C1D0B|nr:DUF2508 family protein [Paenibacillus macerans]MCM3703538.1 DUF2508 family protein [Paenibacillus macerans]